MEQSAMPPSAEAQLGQGEEHDSLFWEYLSEPRHRIKLEELVTASTRTAIQLTSVEKFPLNARISTGQEAATVLKAYEDAIRSLQANAILLGRWATDEQRMTLANMIARMSDISTDGQSGSTICLAMRWYPISLLLYSAGLASLSSDNYATFAGIHTKRIDTHSRHLGGLNVPIIVPVVASMLELAQANVWKILPGQERNRMPESEYLYKTLRPTLADHLFLGNSYESLFDRYEILRALLYADLTDGGWGPLGRFGWKHAEGDGSTYTAIRKEAEQMKDRWEPIKAGLFRGSYSRFEQVAARLENETLNRVGRF